LRVRNKTDHGVFVANYGVVPAGEEATVQQSDGVKQLIKDGTLTEVQSSGGGSSTDDKKDGDA
jgi:hypothetical protein